MKVIFKKPKLRIKYNTYFLLRDIIQYTYNLLYKYRFGFLMILNMIIIFLFSNQKGTNSANVSNEVDNILSNFVLFKILFKAIPIRKCAHFALYFLLGYISYLTINSLYKYRLIYLQSLIICVLYSISDEFHQLFIAGRGASIKDVLIDTLGASICLLFILIKNEVFYDKRN